MKAYVVGDTYQYDGGIVIDSIYTDPNKALVRQQELRREAAASYNNAQMNSSWVLQRLGAITIEEQELK